VKNPKTVFILILLMTVVALIIDLPKNQRLEAVVFNKKLAIVLKRPDINFRLGPIKISNDLSLKKGLDLAGGVHLVFKAETANLAEKDRQQAVESLRDNIERRVNMYGLSEAVVQTSKTTNQDRLVVEIPGQVDPAQAVELIGQTAQLNFVLEEPIAPEATESATIYDLFSKETGLTGANLKKAEVVFDPNTGKPQVALEFDEKGREIFAQITTDNVGKMMAIFLDNFLVSAPSINEPIVDGKGVISGEFALDQAKQMVTQLNAGALPLSVELIEQRTVSATLGEESINKGVRAGLVGVGLVAIFMVGFYGRLGILANFGLFIYAVLNLALYKLIPVTLTMPGVAGFLLSLGMAVDSNILIFERMKEELRLGRPWRTAMELGFGRAWDSIRDANVCTLITTFVLFNPFDWSFLNTSGMVRGFALTLGLGVVLEMFTGIVVVRTLMRVLYGKGGKK
jgi:preprotein translocase subunit SecD